MRVETTESPLFVAYSDAFCTIVPSRLGKLWDLGLNTSTCNWILDFLTYRPQILRGAGHTFSTLSLSMGAAQGCVLGPLLMYTYDYKSRC